MGQRNTFEYGTGFTLLEVVIAVGIVSLLGALSLVSFLNTRRVQNLVTAGNDALSVLRLAREKSAAGHGEDPWGVRLENGQYFLFQGLSYGSSATTTRYSVPPGIEIVDVLLAGGGIEAVFRPPDGRTEEQGTFTVRAQDSSIQTFPVTIDRSGMAYQTGTAPALSGTRVADARHRTFAFNWGIDDATDLIFTFPNDADVRQVAMMPPAIRTSYDSGALTFTVGGIDQTMRIHALSFSPGATTLSIDRDCRRNTKKVMIAIRDSDGIMKDIAVYEADCRTVAAGLYGGVMTEP